METLESLLHRHWRIRAAGLLALESGHTNKTHLVRCEGGDAGRYVLRVSWAGKPVEQVRREASILAELGAWPNLPALPKLMPTVDALSAVRTAEGGWLHLFESIDGTPGLPDDAERGAIDAMQALARLHEAMATIPSHDASPLAWLEARYARVAARPMPPLPADLRARYDAVLARIDTQLTAASTWLTGPARWLHGDYHAGNLLYVDGAVHGVLDFDDVGQGAHWLEAAFALFALSRDASNEERFVFDTRIWEAGLHRYAAARREMMPTWINAKREALALLFCADQTLIHLEAAQRGLWALRAGIGFLGGWRALSSAGAPDRMR